MTGLAGLIFLHLMLLLSTSHAQNDRRTPFFPWQNQQAASGSIIPQTNAGAPGVSGTSIGDGSLISNLFQIPISTLNAVHDLVQSARIRAGQIGQQGGIKRRPSRQIVNSPPRRGIVQSLD